MDVDLLIYRLIKDMTLFLRKRADGNYVAQFTSVMTPEEVELLYRYLGYQNISRTD